MSTAVEGQHMVDGELERRVHQFLLHEADLLHERRFREWGELLADDIVYRVPVRVTVPAGQPEHSEDMFHLDEDRRTLGMRIERFEGTAAWAEMPSSRCRYFVSNVRVAVRDDGDLDVRSYLMLTRLRRSDPEYEMLTGERRDVLRARGDGFELARRTVLLDNTTLGTHNLAFFL